MKEGEKLLIMDGKGHVFESTITGIDPRQVLVTINKSISSLPSSPIDITLSQALIKAHPMDYLIQKVTELGVNSIAPFYSERTIIKIKPGHLNNKMGRWMEITKSACKQCGRPVLPSLHPPVSFEEIIKDSPGNNTLKILLWEHEHEKDLKTLLQSTNPLPHILPIVGPEGGFSPNEINLAREAGFHIVSLGNRILRTETAAVSLVSIIQYEWGDLSIKSPLLKN